MVISFMHGVYNNKFNGKLHMNLKCLDGIVLILIYKIKYYIVVKIIKYIIGIYIIKKN